MKIDWEMIARMSAYQCSGPEISGMLDISLETLGKKAKKEHGCTFGEFMQKHRGKGKIKLRRLQWRQAEKGNITMLIWLGKQYLDQADKKEIQGNSEKPLNVTAKDLTDDELAAIIKGES